MTSLASISRREFLLSSTAAMLLPNDAMAWFPHDVSAAEDILNVHVFEITMAAPDVICFEIRDQAITKGSIYQIPTQRSNPNNWTTVNGVIGHIISPTLNWFRSGDTFPTKYLDRAIIDNAANWPKIGTLTVTNVYRKSYPHDQGITYYGRNQSGLTSMHHYIYCKLSGDLPQGTYTIKYPSRSSLPPSIFTFNDMTTRCHALRATQVGHRPSDKNKLAYLSVWIPGYGSDGAVDFINAYDLTTFNIIDATGANVYTGSIVQRVTPTTVEGGTVNQYSGQITLGIRTVAGVTYSTNCQITTVAPHGFSGGERIQFRGMGANVNGASMNLTYYIGLVGTIVDSTKFMLLDTRGNPVDSSTFRHWVPNVYAPGYDSQIVVMTQKNRAGTYVFGLDYSACVASNLVGKTAPYRVQVPGLGCSYPFAIDDSVWYQAAKIGCAGYYHQTQGMALDGRYGYSHPAAFVDGQNGVQIYWSTMLAAFTSEAQFGSPANNDMGLGASHPWITTNRATGIYGGYKDAGDWTVMNNDSHAQATYSLLAMYEIMGTFGASAQATAFNFPRMSRVLDPTLYAGTDNMGDMMHAAMWEVDCWRRTQVLWNAIPGLPSQYIGGVSSAFGFGSPAPGDGSPSPFEPSWLSEFPAYLCAPDHMSNYYAALLFAKAGIIFRNEGFSTLATIYKTAALSAWIFSENMYGNLTAEDAYYNGYLNMSNNWPNPKNGSIRLTVGHTTLVGSGTSFTKLLSPGQKFFVKYWGVFTVSSVTDNTHVVVTAAPAVAGIFNNAGWGTLGQSATAFRNEMASLDGKGKPASWARYSAACALYRLTGENSYKTIIDANQSNATDFGNWEYMKGPNPTASIVKAFKSGKSNFLWSCCNAAEKSNNAYYCGGNNVLSGMGTGFGTGILKWIYGYLLTTDPTLPARALKMLQATAQNLHGANQYGYCVCTGLGSRSFEWGCLWRDREAQGIKQPGGFIPYSWWPVIGGPGGYQNFVSGDNPSNYTIDFPCNPATSPYPAYHSLGRALQPNRFDMPQWELITENSNVIFNMEATTEQQIIPHWILNCFLSSWDGNPGH